MIKKSPYKVLLDFDQWKKVRVEQKTQSRILYDFQHQLQLLCVDHVMLPRFRMQ